ncbi:hypothetical protein [Massilia sp. DWR3-1-1]|uniref:hypothetical protein n=1 Tax=Massilia sp. DWR3-1-1 TaxID=2804559 RepID=UPI003CED7E4F
MAACLLSDGNRQHASGGAAAQKGANAAKKWRFHGNGESAKKNRQAPLPVLAMIARERRYRRARGKS